MTVAALMAHRLSMMQTSGLDQKAYLPPGEDCLSWVEMSLFETADSQRLRSRGHVRPGVGVQLRAQMRHQQV